MPKYSNKECKLYSHLASVNTGAHFCVNNVSPRGVPKKQNSLADSPSNAALSCVTLRIARERRAATSVDQLFQGTIFVGTLTAGKPLLPPGFSGDTGGVTGDFLRPRNGNRKINRNALSNVRKLLHARKEISALMRPLAPDVNMTAVISFPESIGMN